MALFLKQATIGLLLLKAASATPSWTTLTSTNFNATSWEAQPYVANGYIGQRIPAEGMGYRQIVPINASADDGTSGWPLFDPRFTASMVAGFYDWQVNTSGTNFPQIGGEQPISTLPTWSSLYLTVNGSTYIVGISPSQISNWSQSMSIQDGVVSTSFTWTPFGETKIGLKYTLFAHRARPNLGVVRLDVEGLTGLDVTVTDVLDGAGSWRTTPVSAGVLPKTTDTIYTAVRPNGISNVTAYQTSLLTFPSSSGTPTSSSSACYTASTNASTASQCYAPKSSDAGKLTVIKYVGIASSDAFPGTELSTALHASTHGALTGYDKLLSEHEAAWSALWEDADITFAAAGGDGDDSMTELQLATRASLFHLLSNVRPGSEGPGLGDNSIAPSGLTSDSYAGQVYWDADVWMFPSLMALFPGYAESIVNFRARQLGAARGNAESYGREGALYPWTGGRFGNCTGVGPCYDYEYHLENDIALAQYQYYAGTGDMDWLTSTGWPVISGIAEFWASQVIYNASTKGYDTLNETDPDEYANFRNNAAYTNAGVATTLKNAVSLAPLVGAQAGSNWSQIANGITVLTDPTSGITLEYEGFNGSTAVKQADVVLLTYPLEYHESTTVALQDLDFYALATSPNGPGMTYSIFSIDASALSPVGCASWTYLLAASQPYSRAPFYQFSEQTTDVYASNGGTNPAYTFLTAHGGFLQSLTHGFTGYRSRMTSFYLDPSLPTQLASGYTVKGMRWADSVFDVTLSGENTTIVRRSGVQEVTTVEIATGNPMAGNYSLKVGETLSVPTRHTSGTLVAGNLAQCKTIIGSDVSFNDSVNNVVPGQYALAAIDGSNATAWQPMSNVSTTMTVDLQSPNQISGLHFNWGNNPPTLFTILAGNTTGSMVAIAAGNVSISAPYDAASAEEVSIKIGNITDITLSKAVTARYLNVTLLGSFLADGRGGTLAEFAVL